MAKVTIGGIEYDVPPFNFRRMRKAAPFIERAQAAFLGGPGLTAAMDATADILEILAIGIDQDGVTGASLEEAASIQEAIALNTVFPTILQEMGLYKEGEPKPAEAPAPEKSSPTRSKASSAN